MLALVPLVAALAYPAQGPLPPLPRETENVCARSPEALDAAIAAEAPRLASMWRLAAPSIPMFVLSPACSWRCDGGMNACAEHLMGFLRFTCYDPKFQLGMAAPDQSYHDDTHARFGGRMMRVPEALKEAALQHPKVSEFKQELARLGLRFVEFTSTSVNNPPAGFARVLVLIESDDFDQWYQFAIADGLPKYLSRNVDFSVIQKRDESGARLARHQFFMNGYSRHEIPAKRWEQEGLGNLFGLNRCIMCHPSGLRGIYPRPGSVTPEEADSLKYVQKRLDAEPAAAFGGYYDGARIGPPMGPVDPPGRAALVARCAHGLPAESLPRVAHAMNCASCHDGEYRGLLHAGTDYSTIAHKIVGATPDGIMPPGEALSDKERTAVANCLRQEYMEQFTAWLTETRCARTEPAEPDRRACTDRGYLRSARP